jgi:hypothetical protein
MDALDMETPPPLECVECGIVADGRAPGWRAYIGRGEEFDGVELGIFCRECAEFEFGASELGRTCLRLPTETE